MFLVARASLLRMSALFFSSFFISTAGKGITTAPLEGASLNTFLSSHPMMYRSNDSLLLKFLGRTPETRLIDFFLDNPLFDFTKNEIMEALGMTKRTLYKTLPRLEEMGFVKVSRKIGRAKLYKINLENTAVVKLRELERELSLLEAERLVTDEGEIPLFEEELKEEQNGVASS